MVETARSIVLEPAHGGDCMEHGIGNISRDCKEHGIGTSPCWRLWSMVLEPTHSEYCMEHIIWTIPQWILHGAWYWNHPTVETAWSMIMEPAHSEYCMEHGIGTIPPNFLVWCSQTCHTRWQPNLHSILNIGKQCQLYAVVSMLSDTSLFLLRKLTICKQLSQTKSACYAIHRKQISTNSSQSFSSYSMDDDVKKTQNI